MSQSKATTRPKTRSPLKHAKLPKKPDLANASTTAAARSELSAEVADLAARVERAVKTDGGAATLSPDAVQAMMAALCKVYSAHSENGEHYGAFSQQAPVTPTDVMVTASGLLKAANLAVFELGMWQSWTGR